MTHHTQVYMEENHSETKILKDLDESLSLYADKLEKTTDEDKRTMMTKIITAAREQKATFEKEMAGLSGDDLNKARGNWFNQLIYLKPFSGYISQSIISRTLKFQYFPRINLENHRGLTYLSTKTRGVQVIQHLRIPGLSLPLQLATS